MDKMEGVIPTPRKTIPAMILALAALLVAGCSLVAPEESVMENVTEPPGTTTPQLGEETEGTGLTESTSETTMSEASVVVPEQISPDAVLRFEGDRGVEFSGVCSVGENRNVLSGTVPRRFEFRLSGVPLECSIENRGEGTLRAVLVAGGDTRSVQQTDSAGGTIRVSYSS